MMNRATGRWLPDDLAHIRQSIGDILTTHVASRAYRREYGNAALDAIDARVIGATLIVLVSRASAALRRWEPRIEVQRIVPTILDAGVLLSVTATVVRQGVQLTTQITV
ncbi:MAG: GPW/gp25 family protein [Betaproteobacteria bacterium]|nr:GPW/gp25 family protein [Betaproteobacteria bacterium]